MLILQSSHRISHDHSLSSEPFVLYIQLAPIQRTFNKLASVTMILGLGVHTFLAQIQRLIVYQILSNVVMVCILRTFHTRNWWFFGYPIRKFNIVPCKLVGRNKSCLSCCKGRFVSRRRRR